jgi:aminoglycoside phosphotransferase (APT) family kinase protein
MAADRPAIDTDLVRRLLAAQAPDLAGQPIAPVKQAGTDYSIFRLGDALAVRLPSHEGAVPRIASEHRWLPRLAPGLPLAIPRPMMLGVAGEGYPWPWMIQDWLKGDTALARPPADLRSMATDLGRFLAALHRIDATGMPPGGAHNHLRGLPLAARDPRMRTHIEKAPEHGVEPGMVARMWEEALAVPPWGGPAVFVHGDLQPANLLVREGRLAGVIDFGLMGAGDPAIDLMPAWMFFRGESRAAFREAVGLDDATWRRGRGWALSIGLFGVIFYAGRNRDLVRIYRTMLDAALAGA